MSEVQNQIPEANPEPKKSDSNNNVLITKELNFKTYDVQVPRYRHEFLTPFDMPTNSFKITKTTNPTYNIKFPPNAVNYPRSSFVGRLQVPAKTSVETFIYRDKLSLIRSIALVTSSGTAFIDYTNVHFYNNVALWRDTSYNDLQHRDFKSTIYHSNEYNKGNNTYAYSSNIEAKNVYGITANAAYTGSFTNKEPQHIYSSGVNTAVDLYFEIPLKDLRDTICALDADLLFPSEITLRITFNNVDGVGYENDTSGQDPVKQSISQDITISNFYLKLAIQQNEVIQNQLKNALLSDRLSFNMPFIIQHTRSTSNTLVNLSVDFTTSAGNRVSHIVIIPYIHNTSGANEIVNYYNCDNYNAAKIKYFRTYVNSTPIQSSNVYCYQPTGIGAGNIFGNELVDWDLMQELFKNSVYNNRGMYQKTWFYQEQFSIKDDILIVRGLDKKNDGTGLKLSQLGNSITWQFNATLSAEMNIDWYIFVVFNRKVYMSDKGIYYE